MIHLALSILALIFLIWVAINVLAVIALAFAAFWSGLESAWRDFCDWFKL